jgi:hypothetical protein
VKQDVFHIIAAILFIIVTQLLALSITLINGPVIIQSGYNFAPAGTSFIGSAGNALILVFTVFVATLSALFLVKKKKEGILRFVFFMSSSSALFLLTLLTSMSLLSSYFDEVTALSFSLSASLIVAGSLGLSTFIPRMNFLTPAIIALLSAEVGSYFALTIPFLTALFLPIAFSLYDIYTVYKGPLKHLIAFHADSLRGLSIRIGEFTIGMGDIIFYSMLPSIALSRLDLSCALMTTIAVDSGFLFTLFILSRVKLLPGLPMPMALGLAALLICT